MAQSYSALLMIKWSMVWAPLETLSSVKYWFNLETTRHDRINVVCVFKHHLEQTNWLTQAVFVSIDWLRVGLWLLYLEQ